MLGNPGIWELSSLSIEKPQPYSIAAGVVTIQQGYAELVPETGAIDDVTQVVLGTNFTSTIANYQTMIILRAGSGYTINLKSGTNLVTATKGDMVLKDDTLFIGFHDGTVLRDARHIPASFYDFIAFR